MKRLLAGAALLLPLWGQAGVIIGGSQLLDAAATATLEQWLGQGSLTLTNLYTRSAGDIGVDFHAAADRRGPTFSLMRARGAGGDWQTIGGYNPQSWDSSGQPHFTPDPQDWDAFIFNLSADQLWRQSAAGQSNNRPFDGPTFGVAPLGPDLGVTADLSQVYSWGWSYGGAASRTLSIITGTADAPNMELAALEVFAVGTVAEAPPALLLLSGLAALALTARWRRRAVACGCAPPGRHRPPTPGCPSAGARR